MTDKVSVVARKPFEYGGKVRAPKSGAFAVERAAAEQFQALGLLRIVGDVAKQALQREPKPAGITKNNRPVKKRV